MPRWVKEGWCLKPSLDSKWASEVMLHYVGLPDVAKHVQFHRAINHIPTDSKTDMWLNPWMIDYSRQCKYGRLSSVWDHPA